MCVSKYTIFQKHKEIVLFLMTLITHATEPECLQGSYFLGFVMSKSRTQGPLASVGRPLPCLDFAKRGGNRAGGQVNC